MPGKCGLGLCLVALPCCIRPSTLQQLLQNSGMLGHCTALCAGSISAFRSVKLPELFACRVLSALQQKLNATASEREERKNFVIEKSSDIPDTLKTHPSPLNKTEE